MESCCHEAEVRATPTLVWGGHWFFSNNKPPSKENEHFFSGSRWTPIVVAHQQKINKFPVVIHSLVLSIKKNTAPHPNQPQMLFLTVPSLTDTGLVLHDYLPTWLCLPFNILPSINQAVWKHPISALQNSAPVIYCQILSAPVRLLFFFHVW